MNKLGDALKQEREKRNISLEYIAAQTNINVNALTALENDRFEEIPGGFYFKNYLKSYLKAIDADMKVFMETHGDAISGSYNKRTDTSNTYCTKLKYSRFKKNNILFMILLLVVLTSCLVYWGYHKKEDIIKGWKEWNKKPVGITLPQTGIDFMTPPFREDFNHDYAPLNVAIEFSGRCWVMVHRGKVKIFEKTFQKGEKFETAGYELTLYLDNPAGVRFLVNGKEVTYLQQLKRPEKIILTPVTMGKLFETAMPLAR